MRNRASKKILQETFVTVKLLDIPPLLMIGTGLDSEIGMMLLI